MRAISTSWCAYLTVSWARTATATCCSIKSVDTQNTNWTIEAFQAISNACAIYACMGSTIQIIIVYTLNTNSWAITYLASLNCSRASDTIDSAQIVSASALGAVITDYASSAAIVYATFTDIKIGVNIVAAEAWIAYCGVDTVYAVG